MILPPPVVEVFRKHAKPSGYVLSAGRNSQEPMPYVTYQRMYRETFRELGIHGKYTNHDFRSSYATWLKESGMDISSAADLMGRKDTRMMSLVYAPARHESIIAHQTLINSLVENQLVVPARHRHQTRKPFFYRVCNHSRMSICHRRGTGGHNTRKTIILSDTKKNRNPCICKACGVRGISRARTYDLHDVKVSRFQCFYNCDSSLLHLGSACSP